MYNPSNSAWHFIEGCVTYLEVSYEPKTLIGRYIETTPEEIQYFRRNMKFKNKNGKMHRTVGEIGGSWCRGVQVGSGPVVDLAREAVAGMGR
jgi:hypothetical protein